MLFPIRNCKLANYECEEFDDVYRLMFEVEAAHDQSRCTIELNIPKVDEFGTFNAGGIVRQICSVIKGNPMFNKHGADVNYTYILPPRKVILNWVGEALSRHLRQFFIFGECTETQLANAHIERRLKSSRISHAVNGIAVNYPSKVFLDLGQDKPEQRMPFNTEGILDWTSISQSSGSCGASMYLAKGMVHDANGLFIKRGNPYCNILDELLVLPEHNRRRTTTSNFRAVTELVDPDEPLIHSDEYHGGLHGKHLLTVHAIMPGVYKEQINLSETAAKKLTCTIMKRQAAVVPGWAKSTLRHLVKEGDLVRPGDPLAEYHDEEDISITAHIKRASILRERLEIKSRVATRECTKILYIWEQTHRIKSGDKLTNRHGNKGIVRILPDADMPSVDGQPAEVVVNALATAKRRNPGQIIEAMFNYMRETKDYFDVPETPHFSAEVNGSPAASLIPECKPQKHEYKGQEVMSWSGKVFWMVLDKFSHATGTHVTKRKTDDDGVYADVGKRSGSRIYLTVMQIMLSRGMGPLLDKLIQDNMTGVDKIKKRVYCLANT